ncbi:MAG: DUF1330 domain-containing protein [Rhizobiaceae bacterium]
MPKGYWIARVDVKDPERYKDYVATAKVAFEQFGAKFLARGGPYTGMEGPVRGRNVVIEFETADQARACYNSEQYQKAAKIRQSCAEAELVIVEGV